MGKGTHMGKKRMFKKVIIVKKNFSKKSFRAPRG